MAIKKILVVDDSATDRMFLSEILQAAGYEVTTANDGQDCLNKVKVDMPDLVVMDVVMPGLTGFQVTRVLTKDPETSHIPVIVCTGKEQATDRMWAIRQGAKDSVIKPIDGVDLVNKIQALG